MTFCIVVSVLLLLLHSSSAATILVGGSLGWTNLGTNGVPDYATWAAAQPVSVGDSVVFKYTPGGHTVEMLPNTADFDACKFTNAKTLDSGDSGSFTWKPEKAGSQYFACGAAFEGKTHCEQGQKVRILVSAAGGLAAVTAPVAAPVPTPVASPLIAPTPASPAPAPAPAPAGSPSLAPAPTANPPAIPPVAAVNPPVAAAIPPVAGEVEAPSNLTPSDDISAASTLELRIALLAALALVVLV